MASGGGESSKLEGTDSLGPVRSEEAGASEASMGGEGGRVIGGDPVESDASVERFFQGAYQPVGGANQAKAEPEVGEESADSSSARLHVRGLEGAARSISEGPEPI